MELNIATYNIQHCRDYVRSMGAESEIIDIDKVAATVKGLGIDICALNEVYNKEMLEGGANQAKAIGTALGFNSYFAKAIEYKGFEYGNALLSRFPIVSAKRIPLVLPDGMRKKERYEDRVLLVAELDVSGKPLTVMACHFGLSDEEREFATDIVLDEVKKIKTPLIFMGDLNAQPDFDVISKLRGALCDVSKLTDCEEPTFDSLNPYMKIDYIFTGGDIKVLGADIPRVVCSDHLPVKAKIEI